MNDLHNASSEYRRLRAELLIAYPELAEDDQALLDTLDGIADLDVAIEELLNSAADDEAAAAAVGNRMADLKIRQERLKHRAEKKEAVVFNVMQECGRAKIERPSLTVSIANTPRAVIITDESLIPAAYKTTPAPSVSKKLVGDTLKAGIEVPGATLSNGGSRLSIRRL